MESSSHCGNLAIVQGDSHGIKSNPAPCPATPASRAYTSISAGTFIVTNIAEMLRIRALATPDSIGLCYLEHRFTWREFYLQAHSLSLELARVGIGRGDVVAVYLPHSVGQAVALFAVAMRGAVFTLINPMLVAEQIKHQVSDADARAIVGAENLTRPLSEFFHSKDIAVVPADPAGVAESRWDPDCDLEQQLSAAIPADVCNYIYTSGSTGLPKGVVVPQRTVLDGARIVSGYLRITPDDHILSILPFSFDYGLNQLMSCVFTGARITLHQFIFPTDLVDLLENEGITGMAVVPPVWAKLLKPGIKKDHRFSRLRYVTSGGGFHPPELLRRVTDFLPDTEIIVMYGLTESFRSTYLPFEQIHQRPGCVGRAVPEVDILVLNEQGKPCAPGEKGELVHRGAFVTYGYLNNPQLTAEKFIPLNIGGRDCLPETAVRSGDQVSMDEDGYIYYFGRIDQQIKSSGYRISPDEVAEAVLATPGVALAAAFGLPDEELGEAVHVAYETDSGEPLDSTDIKRHAKASLAAYAIPKHFHFYDKLPLNPNGKVDFGVLKHEARSAGTDAG